SISFGSSVRAIETNEMVDAEAVIEIRVAPRAVAEPPETIGRDDVPPVNRHAPVLAGLAEGIRWRTDGRIEPELILLCPDVGAVAIYHERQIAKERYAVHVGSRPLPLTISDPLKVLIELQVDRQLTSRVGHRGGIPAPERFGPFHPSRTVSGTRGPEQSVVVD